MNNTDSPVVDQGGASAAPPDVVSGVLAEGGALLSETQQPLGTYTVSASWKTPNGAQLGHLQAVIGGVTFKAQGSVTVGSTVRFYSPAGWKARNVAARQKTLEKQAAKAVPAAPASSSVQQLQATHAQPPSTAPLEASVRGLRRHIVVLLKSVDPVGYRKYAEIKYAGTDSPGLVQRRRAYVFAFERLMERGYNVPNTD